MCQSEKRALIRRIAAAGCPIDVDPGPDELTILQKGEARIMDMGYGYIGIVLYMMLVREVPGQIVVEEFGGVFLPWDALSVTWLDPLPNSSRTAVYKLPNGFSLGRDPVLNDKLGESGIRLRAGHHVEGWVLGYAKTTIPETYNHGALLPAQFSMVDVLGREYCGDIVFFVDRMGGRISLPAVRPGAGLYEPCDPPGKSTEDQSARARPRLGDRVQWQGNAVAEEKVPRNRKGIFRRHLGSHGLLDTICQP